MFQELFQFHFLLILLEEYLVYYIFFLEDSDNLLCLFYRENDFPDLMNTFCKNLERGTSFDI